jgi:DNA-binding NarL/FixJ family response regulator
MAIAISETGARLRVMVVELAEKTVKNYVSSILGKLEFSRRAEAATYLVRHASLSG